MNCTYYHPWHTMPYGENAPAQVNAIIEITQGSKAKYELDKQTGLLRLDRILSSHLRYPFHYGFIPQTYCSDNDPLDILILCSEELVPLSIVEATVLGSLHMIDNGEQDDKIIAVAANDPTMKHIKTLDDLGPDAVNNIRTFFQEYKKPEGKVVTVEAVIDKGETEKLITQSIALYKKHFR